MHEVRGCVVELIGVLSDVSDKEFMVALDIRSWIVKGYSANQCAVIWYSCT